MSGQTTLTPAVLRRYFSCKYIGMYYVNVKYLCIKELKEQGHKWVTISQMTGIPVATCRNIVRRCQYYPEMITEDWRQWIVKGLYPVTIKLSTDEMIYRLYRNIPSPTHHAYRYEKGVPQADA